MEEIRPLVSVVVPNFNHAKYLKERLDSILSQTYQNFEIIILDDCSTDNSKEVIEKYRVNPHVSHIVYNKENSGKVFSQWQKGFSLAQGELIWIAESDDKCMPTLLEELVNEFEFDSNLALAFSRTMYFNDSGLINVAYGEIKNKSTEHLHGNIFIKKYMIGGCYVANASSAVFKKEIATNIDNIYTTFKGAGDRLFWIEIAEKGNVAIINKPLNFCRRHNTNVTDKNWSSGVIQREEKQILDYLINRGLISTFHVQIVSAQYIYNHILNQEFKSKETQQQLLKFWDNNLLKQLIILPYRVRSLGSKIKRILTTY